MYKLICLDMDGTLLNSSGKISPGNLQAIKSAHEKGVKVTICTGRVFTSAAYYGSLLGVKVPIIALNGAYIREKDKDEVIYKSVLGTHRCRKILKVLKKYGIYAHFNAPDMIFTEKIIYSSEGYSRINKDLPDEWKINIQVSEDWERVFEKYGDYITKCIAIDDDVKKIRKAKEELLQDEEIEVVSSWYNNIEIMCKGVSKGRAVKVLSGFYNIKREEIMCIGDNENDISMIKYAGLGVAMGNAEEFVKNEADFVTDKNDEDGVARAIEKFVLS